MANQRQSRISPSNIQAAPAVVPRARRWPWVLVAVVAALVALAWFDGGEEPLRPIAEDLPLPEQGR